MNQKALLALVTIGPMLGGCWDTGQGEKVGTITRLNKRGVFCKTWEGEIIRGGLSTGTGIMGQAFSFTVENEALVPKLEEAMTTGREVKIGFRSEGVTFCRSDSDDHFLTSIEYLGAPPVAARGDAALPDATLKQLLEQMNALLQQLAARPKP